MVLNLFDTNPPLSKNVCTYKLRTSGTSFFKNQLKNVIKTS